MLMRSFFSYSNSSTGAQVIAMLQRFYVGQTSGRHPLIYGQLDMFLLNCVLDRFASFMIFVRHVKVTFPDIKMYRSQTLVL